MRVRKLGFHRWFALFLTFGFSYFLSGPLVEAMGYSVPSPFGRAFFLGLFILFIAGVKKTVFLLLPVLVAIPLTGGIWYWRDSGGFMDFLGQLGGPYPHSFLFIPLLVMTLLTLVLDYLVRNPTGKRIVFTLSGAGILLVLWYFFIDDAYGSFIGYTGFWLLFLGYSRGMPYWTRDGSPVLRGLWIKYTGILVLVVLGVTLVLPKDFEPLHIPGLQRVFLSVFPWAQGLRGFGPDGGFSDGAGFASTTFTGLGIGESLGGPLEYSTSVLLEVRDQGGFYLRAGSYDLYSGSGWSSTFDAKSYIPTPLDFPLDRVSGSIVEPLSFGVRYNSIDTNKIFALQFTEEITGISEQLFVDDGNSFSISNSLSWEVIYRVRGYQLNPEVEIPEVENPEISSRPTNSDWDGESYLQIPSDLPDRVKERALALTENLVTDLQKIRALELYLSSGFAYSETFPSLEPDQDFVDHFLFEVGSGYCTAFASALAVMARVVGIPARYVVGFRVPEQAAYPGIYHVTGYHAHTWVEGYIDGLGWLPFEPTPDFQFSGPAGTAEELETGDTLDGTGEGSPSEPDTPGSVSGDSDGDQRKKWGSRVLGILGGSILAGFLGFFLLIGKRLFRIRNFLEDLPTRDPSFRIIVYYNLCLSLLDQLGLQKLPGETPLVFSNRILHSIPLTDELNFQEFSGVVSRVLYSSPKGGSSDEAAQGQRFFRYLFLRYKIEIGIVPFLWNLGVKKKIIFPVMDRGI